jgi:hypothetical protein
MASQLTAYRARPAEYKRTRRAGTARDPNHLLILRASAAVSVALRGTGVTFPYRSPALPDRFEIPSIPSFGPWTNGRKALAYLYPANDRALLACIDVPFGYRLLWVSSHGKVCVTAKRSG